MEEEILDEMEEVIEVKQHDMMELFEELSFKEKWHRVMEGIKQPPDTGEYKWAKLQMVRLSAPIAAVVVPIITILLLMVLAVFKPPPRPPVQTRILEPEQVEELDDIEEIIEEPPEPPDPVEIDFDPDVNINTPNPAPPTDFSPKPAKFDSVAMVKSPVIMKNIYGSRSPGARGQMRASYGGNGATEGAVMRALRWLKTKQNSDGSWNNEGKQYGEAKAAYTGMALLTYLAHGETPTSAEFGQTVESAIKYLVGDFGGDTFKARDKHNYTHPIAAYALCEAYGLTKIPMLRDAAQKAIAKVVKGQNASGGWDYNMKGGNRDDTSYMGWCAQSLKAAKMAGVMDDNSALKGAMKKAIKGFQKNSAGSGGFGYTGPSPSGLTGVGVLCMQLLGGAREAEVTKGLAWLEKHAKFDWDNDDYGQLGKCPIYYTYYITQAKFHHGGETWNAWNKQFAVSLVRHQDIIGKEASNYKDHKGNPQEIGYWDSPAKDEHSGGRVQDTCLSTLQLQVYYRYLPTFKAPSAVEEVEEIGDAEEDIEVDIDISS